MRLASLLISSDNRALLSLDISSNSLVEASPKISVANSYKAGDLVEYNGLQCPVQAAGSNWYRVYMLHGVVALADAIPDNGAMTSLNLASNHLGIKGAKIIAACLPKCT